MRKKLRNWLAGAGALLLAGMAPVAQASHFQGSELTYLCVAPGIYQVNLKLYRDCSGVTAPTTAFLTLQSAGCVPQRNVNMTKVGNTTVGNPYCPQISAPCTGSSLYPNYEEVIFTTQVTFSPAELNCPDWKLSWTECCRPGSATIASAAGYALYTEAYLNLGSSNALINNNSPEFGSLVVPYVNYNMPITISAYATDIDDDSLVYSLSTPLDQPTVSTPYDSYQSVLLRDPDTTSTKVVMLPAGTYSATFPMHAYAVDWSQATPVATPYFNLNSQSGSLSFTPTAYFPNTPPIQGKNKYVTVVTVDEYRNINGQPVKIGSIRRDMFITVMDCGPNQNPSIILPVANGQPIVPEDVISLRPGTPLTLTFSAADNNSNDILTMESDVEQVLPGARFLVTNSNSPSGTLTWTPTAADVKSNIYYFRVTVKDNACPVRGVQVQTFAVRVSHTGGVTGTRPELKLNTGFTAFPNPFTNQVNFRLGTTNNAESILIYNLLGQQIDKITVSNTASAEKNLQWNNASKHASGTYIAKLVSKDKTIQTLKFTKVQ